ncbi:complement C1q binding protein P32 isoform X1 [Amblyomma americanum]
MAANVIGTVSRAFTKPTVSNAVVRALKHSNGHGYRSMSSAALTRTLACRHTARSSGLLRTATCSYSQTSTKGDQELADFLVEEIEAEKKARKSAQLPKIEGFDVKLEGSEVTLTRTFNQETVTVRLNVNHSVDAEDADEFSANQDNTPEAGEMKSKPNFTVEIERDGKKLFFSCTFSEGGEPEGQAENYADSFGVAEFAIYEGEWTDEVYTVSGDIMDGYLYDLLMNMLEERGISSEFGYNLVNFCTVYEHSLYIGLLEKLKAFVSKK